MAQPPVELKVVDDLHVCRAICRAANATGSGSHDGEGCLVVVIRHEFSHNDSEHRDSSDGRSVRDAARLVVDRAMSRIYPPVNPCNVNVSFIPLSPSASPSSSSSSSMLITVTPSLVPCHRVEGELLFPRGISLEDAAAALKQRKSDFKREHGAHHKEAVGVCERLFNPVVTRPLHSVERLVSVRGVQVDVVIVAVDMPFVYCAITNDYLHNDDCCLDVCARVLAPFSLTPWLDHFAPASDVPARVRANRYFTSQMQHSHRGALKFVRRIESMIGMTVTAHCLSMKFDPKNGGACFFELLDASVCSKVTSGVVPSTGRQVHEIVAGEQQRIASIDLTPEGEALVEAMKSFKLNRFPGRSSPPTFDASSCCMPSGTMPSRPNDDSSGSNIVIAEDESDVMEFKHHLSRWEEGICTSANSERIRETVAAMANRKGGTILIGVDDNGAVIGVSSDEDVKIRCAGFCPPMVAGAVVQQQVPLSIMVGGKRELPRDWWKSASASTRGTNTQPPEKKQILHVIRVAPAVAPFHVCAKDLTVAWPMVRGSASTLPMATSTVVERFRQHLARAPPPPQNRKRKRTTARPVAR